MSEWKTYKLSEIAEVFTGFPFKGEKYDMNNGIRVLRGENVSLGYLRWDSIKHWNEEFSEAEKYALNVGDIVIGMDG
jgi:type I restriction enzyme, S subunit